MILLELPSRSATVSICAFCQPAHGQQSGVIELFKVIHQLRIARRVPVDEVTIHLVAHHQFLLQQLQQRLITADLHLQVVVGQCGAAPTHQPAHFLRIEETQ